jgi:glyoxylase-like metal-dependent hydrolase (beta-lactamase superfamily II)
MEPITVGSLVVQPIFDGTARLMPDMFTTAEGPADWSDHQHLLDGEGAMIVPVGCFVVRTGEEIVLIDAGGGILRDEMFDTGAMMTNLASAGIQPGDVDRIVLTHLHVDHCGWVEHQGKVTFPNAAIHVGAADWHHYVRDANPDSTRATKLRVVEEHVELIDRDNVTVAAGITTRATPGHTPGHTSLVISSGTDRLIVLGDALHCPAQLTNAEWEFLYDADPNLAKHSRAALLAEAEVPNTALLPCHFPGMVAARLLSGSGHRHWVIG